MKDLLATRFADAIKVRVVCDNLNTHRMGAFYEAFGPIEARALCRRIEFIYTPKHGSWLNISENELSCFTRQCIDDRRFETIEEMQEESTAWCMATNATERGVDWQFTVDDAHQKLRSLYPNI